MLWYLLDVNLIYQFCFNVIISWLKIISRMARNFYFQKIGFPLSENWFIILYILYVITKAMCPPGYHRNGFVVTHAFRNVIYGYTLLVPLNQRVVNKPSKEHNLNGLLILRSILSLLNALCFLGTSIV